MKRCNVSEVGETQLLSWSAVFVLHCMVQQESFLAYFGGPAKVCLFVAQGASCLMGP